MSVSESLFSKKVPAIIVLSLIYIFIAIFSENIIVNPLIPGTYLGSVELVVPIAAAIIFGGVIGGSVAAIGYFFTEIIFRFVGQVHDPFGLIQLIVMIGYFIGSLVIGRFAIKKREEHSSLKNAYLDLKTWYRIFSNSFTSIIGLAIISNLIISFGNVLITQSPVDNGLNAFLQLFYQNFIMIIPVVPFTLFLYETVEVLRLKRQNKLDEEYRYLDTEIEEDGPAKIENIEFDDHAFKIGTWTPINILFSHSWKANRSYEIESISSARIYPHTDVTSVLEYGDGWKHTIYVLPLKQEHVDIKVRINPSQTKKFKQTPSQQTMITIHGKTYSQRDLLIIGVVILSEVIISLFLFSILWSQIAEVLLNVFIKNPSNNTPIQSITIPWNLLLVIGGVEAVFFIPFLLIMYGVQRQPIDKHEHHELAFTQDINTHRYLGEPENKSYYKIFIKFILVPAITVATILLSIWGISILIDHGRDLTTNNTDQPLIDLQTELLLISSLVILWFIGVKLMNNILDFIRSENDVQLQKGKFIQSIEALSQFQENTPTEMLITVKNTSSSPGLRIIFEANDAISPPKIELHIAPNETATFKVAVTANNKGKHEILAIVYPLFNDAMEYLPLKDTQPIGHQNISYKVLGETIIGITSSQARNIKHLTGWGGLLASVISFANRYIGVEEVITQWRETVPWLVTLQVPFLYIYYIFSNRFFTKIESY